MGISTSKLLEFFQDNTGAFSMGRLMFFLSFFPASFVVLYTEDTDALGLYLGAYAVSYVGGKCADAYQDRGRQKYANNSVSSQELAADR